MLSTFFSPRRDRRALQQLLTAVTTGLQPDVKGCAQAKAVTEAWQMLQTSSSDAKSRINALEQELESAREVLHESAISASAHEVRFDLVNRASSGGLWDMEVVAGDPVNPKNRFWWSQQLRSLLGFNDERDFPNVLASWANRLHPQDKQATLMLLPGTSMTSRVILPIRSRTG